MTAKKKALTSIEINELANKHWEWFEPIASLIIPKLAVSEQIWLTKYLCTTNMIHGVKHGIEYWKTLEK